MTVIINKNEQLNELVAQFNIFRAQFGNAVRQRNDEWADTAYEAAHKAFRLIQGIDPTIRVWEDIPEVK